MSGSRCSRSHPPCVVMAGTSHRGTLASARDFFGNAPTESPHPDLGSASGIHDAAHTDTAFCGDLTQ